MKLNRKTKSPETRDQVASMHFCHQFSVCASSDFAALNPKQPGSFEAVHRE